MKVMVDMTEPTVPIDLAGSRVDPAQLHTGRPVWVILDETTSDGAEPVDLIVTTRTYQSLKTLIAAAASGDDEISIFDVPRNWNGARFRAIGITDGATITYQVYAGTLGDGFLNANYSSISATPFDCELAYLGQFAFTVGTQASIYSQVAFTSGGTTAIVAGDVITGATSGSTAIVTGVGTITGTWAAGTAAGTLQLITRNGAFQSENLNTANQDDQATIGADLVAFEMADTLTVTASDWTKSFITTTPTGNRVAETRIDLIGTDILVFVPTVVTADCKLLGKGL